MWCGDTVIHNVSTCELFLSCLGMVFHFDLFHCFRLAKLGRPNGVEWLFYVSKHHCSVAIFHKVADFEMDFVG